MGPTGLVFLSIVTDLCILTCIIYLLRVIYQSNNCKELLFRKNIFCSSSFYIYIKTSKSGMKFCQDSWIFLLTIKTIAMCQNVQLFCAVIRIYIYSVIFKHTLFIQFLSGNLTAISFPNIRYVYIRYSFHGQSLNPEPYLFITFFDVLVLQKDVRTWTTSREA